MKMKFIKFCETREEYEAKVYARKIDGETILKIELSDGGIFEGYPDSSMCSCIRTPESFPNYEIVAGEDYAVIDLYDAYRL